MAVMNLTIDVPDATVQQFRTLDDDNRRDFLQKVNAFAVSTLAEEDTEEVGYYLPDPGESPPIHAGVEASTLADAKAVQEAFADFDAGDRGKSPQEAFARLAPKYGIKDPVL